MTEVVVGSAEQQGGEQVAQPTSSGAGHLLRQARERQQLSIQAVASTLKVPVYKLQALEEDRWDVLTDSVFTRSLALSLCRLLNIASEPVLAGLPKHEAAKLAANPEGINAPFKEKTLRSLMSSSQDSGAGNGAKIVAALLIAVAGGAGLYFVPQWHSSDDAAMAATSDGTVDEPLFMPQLSSQSEAPAVETVAAADAATSVSSEEVGKPAPEAAPVVSGPVAESAPSAAAAGARVLRFKATGETWIQVNDAQQKVLAEKILKAGDVFEETVAGRPLYVVVGNAGVTTLEVDGAALDLMASAKNNVARIEVK